MYLVYNSIKNVKNSFEIVHEGGFPLHGLSGIWKMESTIDMRKSFFTTLNGKQCIPFPYTVFITKG